MIYQICARAVWFINAAVLIYFVVLASFYLVSSLLAFRFLRRYVQRIRSLDVEDLVFTQQVEVAQHQRRAFQDKDGKAQFEADLQHLARDSEIPCSRLVIASENHVHSGAAVGAAQQLSGILTYVEKLNELDTKSTEPTAHVLDIKNVMRDDVAVRNLSQEKALSNAPEKSAGHYKVPKIIE